MFSNLHSTRSLAVALLAVIAVGAGLAPAAQAQSDATLRVVSETFAFQDDTVLTVDVEIDGTVELAGLDFVISYPEELVPAETEATLDSELWNSVLVNYDRDDATYSPEPGRALISAAAASATNVASVSGRVVTLNVPVTCLGNAQQFPEGRDVTFELIAVDATRVADDQDGDGLDDVVGVVVATEDGIINLNCTTVSSDDASFGTLKSFFGASTEVR
ncbi:MAG TPA: hypothetical protein VKA86_00660 [Candidatus Krumholzibacteria bacterium]|nr:hypothetical protein [Candidatus Krumholzibacteria bacterium]